MHREQLQRDTARKRKQARPNNRLEKIANLGRDKKENTKTDKNSRQERKKYSVTLLQYYRRHLFLLRSFLPPLPKKVIRDCKAERWSRLPARRMGGRGAFPVGDLRTPRRHAPSMRMPPTPLLAVSRGSALRRGQLTSPAKCSLAFSWPHLALS